MNTMHRSVVKGSLLVCSLLIISGCEYFKKREVVHEEAKETSVSKAEVVLCTIDGETSINEADFLKNLTQMMRANPYFKGAKAESLPKGLQRKFFDQLATQALIEKHSIKNNVEKDSEFIKAYEETEKLLKRSLMVQIFEKKIYDGLKIGESEIKKYYNENRKRFVKSAGGVLAMGASFGSEDLASGFLSKVKDKLDDFEKLSKENKDAKFKDFGRISKEMAGAQYEFVPGPIKESALAMRKLPGVEKVKVGKDYWVIKSWDKKDTVIFDLEEIKPHVEAMLKNNQFKDELEKRIKEVKGNFDFVVNEDYFKEESAPKKEDKKGSKPRPSGAAVAV